MISCPACGFADPEIAVQHRWVSTETECTVWAEARVHCPACDWLGQPVLGRTVLLRPVPISLRIRKENELYDLLIDEVTKEHVKMIGGNTLYGKHQ